jgi:hypothetical protein
MPAAPAFIIGRGGPMGNSKIVEDCRSFVDLTDYRRSNGALPVLFERSVFRRRFPQLLLAFRAIETGGMNLVPIPDAGGATADPADEREGVGPGPSRPLPADNESQAQESQRAFRLAGVMLTRSPLPRWSARFVPLATMAGRYGSSSRFLAPGM